jgi:hypothetical protein
MTATVTGLHLSGKTGWSPQHDLWLTLTAAQRLLRLDLGGGPDTVPTELVTFPGPAVILVPAATRPVSPCLFRVRTTRSPPSGRPAGPYMIAISAAALFAADALAESAPA